MFRFQSRYQTLSDNIEPPSQPETAHRVSGGTQPVLLQEFGKPASQHVYSSISTFEGNEIDEVKETRTKRSCFVAKKGLTGYRAGARLATAIAICSLLINLIVSIWAGARWGFKDAIIEVYNGDCRRAESINTWVHLFINVLSTLLLSASNYCMQCLSAPSRQDIDKAHAKKRWLDIGVPSVRNLRNIPIKKVLVWWSLGISSVPLHLM